MGQRRWSWIVSVAMVFFSARSYGQGTAGKAGSGGSSCGDCEKQLAVVKAENATLKEELGKLKETTELKSPEGYRDARWGMSLAEVKKLFPSSVSSPDRGMLLMKGQTSSEDSTTAFVFTSDKLTRVVVTFTKEYVNKNNYISAYDSLKGLLKQKYGEPKDDVASWSQGLYKDNPDQWGMAISAGHLTLWTRWETEKTTVRLFCSGENFKIGLSIGYSSKELADLQKKASAAKKLEDL